MWPFGKTPERQKDTADKVVTLRPEDGLHTRVEKSFRYAGFVNPNRIGAVDSVAFILGEYERLDAQKAQQRET